MPNLIELTIARIKRAAGLTDEQMQALMPHGPNSPEHYVGGIVQGVPDKRSWAEKEYEKDNEGWNRV